MFISRLACSCFKDRHKDRRRAVLRHQFHKISILRLTRDQVLVHHPLLNGELLLRPVAHHHKHQHLLVRLLTGIAASMTFRTRLSILLNLQQVTSRVRVFEVQLLDSTRALVRIYDLHSQSPVDRLLVRQHLLRTPKHTLCRNLQLRLLVLMTVLLMVLGSAVALSVLTVLRLLEQLLPPVILLVHFLLLLRSDHFARSRIVLLLPVLLTLTNNSIMVLASKAAAVVVQALPEALLLQPLP
jgi:hypothetical protein